MQMKVLDQTLRRWQEQARNETFDPALTMTDLEWLGGRIAALGDVLILLESGISPKDDLRVRLLGDETAMLATNDGDQVQGSGAPAEDQTRSKLSK